MKTFEQPIDAAQLRAICEAIDSQWVAESDRQQLAASLAHQVGDWLTRALIHQPRASLAVSGGRTPVIFFEELSILDLPWSRIDITLADERWVDPEDDASNERLVRLHLLRNKAKAARFFGLMNEAANPEQGAKACEERLSTLHWPLDVAVLGMGNDGHTASLFPGADGVSAALSAAAPGRCAPVYPVNAPHPRMTLTLPALAGARHSVLHITGEDKLATLDEVMADLEDIDEMPVRAFMRPGLHIYWAP